MKTTGLLSAALLATSFAMPAAAQLSVEDQIEARKAAYQFMSWNRGKINALVPSPPIPANFDRYNGSGHRQHQ